MTQKVRAVAILLTLFVFTLARCARFPYPSLWESVDPPLQKAFEASLRRQFGEEFWTAVREKKIGIALVDITDLIHPKVARLNGDEMMYAASLPKIAILLGAFVEIERGNLELDEELRGALNRMIRISSNEDATRVLNLVGFENLAAILRSDRYRLYDPDHNGGLWVGRDYSGNEWRRDPLHDISHGATAMQVARFYYLGVTGRLVAPEFNDELLEIMSDPDISHMFVRGLREENPEAEIYRKSGSWGEFHADSGVVVAEGYRYIIAAIAEHPMGEEDLADLIGAVEETMQRRHPD